MTSPSNKFFKNTFCCLESYRPFEDTQKSPNDRPLLLFFLNAGRHGNSKEVTPCRHFHPIFLCRLIHEKKKKKWMRTTLTTLGRHRVWPLSRRSTRRFFFFFWKKKDTEVFNLGIDIRHFQAQRVVTKCRTSLSRVPYEILEILCNFLFFLFV
jgi:hypothetical protein